MFSQTIVLPAKHSKNPSNIYKHLLDQGLQSNGAIFSIEWNRGEILKENSWNVRKTRHLPVTRQMLDIYRWPYASSLIWAFKATEMTT